MNAHAVLVLLSMTVVGWIGAHGWAALGSAVHMRRCTRAWFACPSPLHRYPRKEPQ